MRRHQRRPAYWRLRSHGSARHRLRQVNASRAQVSPAIAARGSERPLRHCYRSGEPARNGVRRSERIGRDVVGSRVELRDPVIVPSQGKRLGLVSCPNPPKARRAYLGGVLSDVGQAGQAADLAIGMHILATIT
jgi:hypothetical protein